MGDKKKLPKGLSEKQELQREDTINKVLRAVADIKNEGKQVTVSTLVDHTGLSRSTFAKPHVRELLAERRGCTDDGATGVKRKKVKQAEAIAEKDRQIAELREKNAELKQECELLRGKLFLAMEKRGVK